MQLTKSECMRKCLQPPLARTRQQQPPLEKTSMTRRHLARPLLSTQRLPAHSTPHTLDLTLGVYVMLSWPRSHVAIESRMVLLHWSLLLGSSLAMR